MYRLAQVSNGLTELRALAGSTADLLDIDVVTGATGAHQRFDLHVERLFLSRDAGIADELGRSTLASNDFKRWFDMLHNPVWGISDFQSSD